MTNLTLGIVIGMAIGFGVSLILGIAALMARKMERDDNLTQTGE